MYTIKLTHEEAANIVAIRNKIGAKSINVMSDPELVVDGIFKHVVKAMRVAGIEPDIESHNSALGQISK